jgi:hypothetical protein
LLLVVPVLVKRVNPSVEGRAVNALVTAGNEDDRDGMGGVNDAGDRREHLV